MFVFFVFQVTRIRCRYLVRLRSLCVVVSAAAAAGAPENEYLYKLLVVGDLGCGKTSIIHRYVSNVYSTKYRATVRLEPQVLFVSCGVFVFLLRALLQPCDVDFVVRFFSFDTVVDWSRLCFESIGMGLENKHQVTCCCVLLLACGAPCERAGARAQTRP